MLHYGIFQESNDEFVNLGKWESDVDAHIAIAEHGLDRELGEEYYVAIIDYRMIDGNLVIEPYGDPT